MISQIFLQSKGVENLYLTQNPVVNVFKYVYAQYLDFATNLISLNLTETVNFGKKSSVIIPRDAHMLSKMYLYIKLPQLTPTSGTYACWSDTIGYGIFSSPIELTIGGTIIEKLYPEALDILDEFGLGKNKTLGMNEMLLKSDVFVSGIHNAERETELMIPLNFWFCKDYSLALPVLSLTNQEIKINFSFKNFQDVINYDGVTPPDTVSILDSKIFAEYIYFPQDFANAFMNKEHFYCVDQTVFNGLEKINTGSGIKSYSSKLSFTNPLKELFFACVDSENYDTNNYFNYSMFGSEDSIVKEINMLFDNKFLFDSYFPESIFRQLYTNNNHTVIPDKYIYTIPFGIRPEDNQPTGNIVLPYFSDVKLALKLNPNLINDVYLYIFGRVYNFISISNGNLTTLFSA